MESPQWEVIGGGGRGILVRTGQALDSPEASERLSSGACIAELALMENRLHYKLVTGVGPAEGWVSVSVAGKALLKKMDRTENAGDAAGTSRTPSVYALSDLHTDQKPNMQLIEQLDPRPDDVILLVGDIAPDTEVVRKTFNVFLAKFRYVFFCAGNHDLWIQRNKGAPDSIQKLHQLLALCDEMGVITKPRAIGDVLIVPLHSWYEPAFDKDPNVEDESIAPVEKTMTDFMLCKWPDGLSSSDSSVSKHIDALNGELPDTSGYKAVISFSHFLPLPELVPEKRFLFYPHLPKAIGSLALNERLQQLRPSCHVFGHTHYGWSVDIDGTHYLQPAVAYPRERKERGFALGLGDAEQQQEQPERTTEGGITSPVLVYDASVDSLVRYQGFWSSYYKTHPRCPSDVQWIYRPPRKKEEVQAALRKIVDSGQQVEDSAIASMITEK